MSETYTNKQAMDKLGLVSIGALHQIKRKYPHAFVVIRPGTKGIATLYEKKALDKFAEIRQALKEIGQL
jgi:hypothetical protein